MKRKWKRYREGKAETYVSVGTESQQIGKKGENAWNKKKEETM